MSAPPVLQQPRPSPGAGRGGATGGGGADGGVVAGGQLDDGAGSEGNILLITAGVVGCVALAAFGLLYTYSMFCVRRRRRRAARREQREADAYAGALEAPTAVFDEFLLSHGISRAEVDRLCPERVHCRGGAAAWARVLDGLDAASPQGMRRRFEDSACHSAAALGVGDGDSSTSVGESSSVPSVPSVPSVSNTLASKSSSSDTANRAPDGDGSGDDAVGEGVVCVICLEELRDGDMERELPCPGRHVFHSGCIQVWLTKRVRCPTCNKGFEVKHERRRARGAASRRVADAAAEAAAAAPPPSATPPPPPVPPPARAVDWPAWVGWR